MVHQHTAHCFDPNDRSSAVRWTFELVHTTGLVTLLQANTGIIEWRISRKRCPTAKFRFRICVPRTQIIAYAEVHYEKEQKINKIVDDGKPTGNLRKRKKSYYIGKNSKRLKTMPYCLDSLCDSIKNRLEAQVHFVQKLLRFPVIFRFPVDGYGKPGKLTGNLRETRETYGKRVNPTRDLWFAKIILQNRF